MPNHGERTLVVKMPAGKPKSMRNQVCPCIGPLTSVARLIDSDNFVGFSTAGSFVLDLKSGDIDWMIRRDDTFELELEVVPYAEAKAMPSAKAVFQKKSGGQGPP